MEEKENKLENEEGEMVITEPMPCMPIYFWNDEEKVRYNESYFEMYDGLWRHGDWIRITQDDGVVIYGRSDATLNKQGIRIGTSEIYRSLDHIQEIVDSLIVNIEKKDGDHFMPLFVMLKEGIILDDILKKRIKSQLRSDYSPRHVPDEIIQVADIPYTLSGKKMETQVQYLPMMREAVKNGKAKGSSLALLVDRVALRQGKRQIYGSQIARDQDSPVYYVSPLEDPDNVDKRRAEVGLGPLSEYVSRWQIKWDVEQYKKDLLKMEEKMNIR